MDENLEELTLLETLDHLLDRDVDLLYLGLNIVLANVDAIKRTSKR
jgi:hypothetical protein